MIHDFEYNGQKLSELGAVISENPHYALSVRELNFDSIPHKSGDIITDKNTGANYVLEINRCPQLVTGSFLDEKYTVLRDYLKRQARS